MMGKLLNQIGLNHVFSLIQETTNLLEWVESRTDAKMPFFLPFYLFFFILGGEGQRGDFNELH